MTTEVHPAVEPALALRSYDPVSRLIGDQRPFLVEELPNGKAYHYALSTMDLKRRSLLGRWARWFAKFERFSDNARRSAEIELALGLQRGMAVTDGGLLVKTQLIVFQVSLTPASVATIVCTEQALTVTGVLSNDILVAAYNTVANATNTLPVAGHVSAANTIALGYCNPTAGALVPTPGTYNIIVLRG